MQLQFLKKAVSIAEQNVQCGGGPFGAVIVKDGKVLAESGNSVTLDGDPTAHAEVNAIRKACKALSSHDLSGAEIYCSCEPCPMCLGAIYWARLKGIYFAASRSDAKCAGFDDEKIYTELGMPISRRSIPTEQVLIPGASAPFAAWEKKSDKETY